MSLASSFVGSPDPRQQNPPEGEELIVEWRIPSNALKSRPTLILDVIYKNHVQESFKYPIYYRRGKQTYSLLNKDFQDKGGLLTYKSEVVLEEGQVIAEWKQQLWTDLIVIE